MTKSFVCPDFLNLLSNSFSCLLDGLSDLAEDVAEGVALEGGLSCGCDAVFLAGAKAGSGSTNFLPYILFVA